jgi:hypothetical protein
VCRAFQHHPLHMHGWRGTDGGQPAAVVGLASEWRFSLSHADHGGSHAFLRAAPEAPAPRCAQAFCRYVCTCMYVCIYVCMYVCMCVNTHTLTHTHTSTCMYVCVCICKYTHTHTHMCVCVCACVCMCVCIYIHTHIHTYIHAYIHVHVNTHTHTHTHASASWYGSPPLCVFITAGPITKLCAWGEEDSGGHVL